MSVVAVAIVLSFHLKNQPSQIELRMAKPLGTVFWVLSVLCLCVGIGNYISKASLALIFKTKKQPGEPLLTSRPIETVNKYSKKAAIVQTGWRTQLVSDTSRPPQPYASW
jgi:hypothetical protein